ncbi:MAG TPA: hypothetical protein VE077_18155 [Candidatus Methylomirabilis sp.]|nr:hypothetical protein [Candidatus Methylomirabilis sp.]
MLVYFFLPIQDSAIAFHPCVGFHLLSGFADADAQIAGNSLAPQEPPERERFFETSGMADAMPNRGAHDACDERGLGT